MNRWAYDVASEQIKSLHEEARTATLVRSMVRARMARLLTTWAHRLDPSLETGDLPAHFQPRTPNLQSEPLLCTSAGPPQAPVA